MPIAEIVNEDQALNVKNLTVPELPSSSLPMGLTHEEKQDLLRAAQISSPNNLINRFFTLPAVVLFPEFIPIIQANERVWEDQKERVIKGSKNEAYHRTNAKEEGMEFRESAFYSQYKTYLRQAKLVFPRRFKKELEGQINPLDIKKLKDTYNWDELPSPGVGMINSAETFIEDSFTYKVLYPGRVIAEEFERRWHKLNTAGALSKVIKLELEYLNKKQYSPDLLFEIKLLAPNLLNGIDFSDVRNNPRSYIDAMRGGFNPYAAAMHLFVILAKRAEITEEGIIVEPYPTLPIATNLILPEERSF